MKQERDKPSPGPKFRQRPRDTGSLAERDAASDRTVSVGAARPLVQTIGAGARMYYEFGLPTKLPSFSRARPGWGLLSWAVFVVGSGVFFVVPEPQEFWPRPLAGALAWTLIGFVGIRAGFADRRRWAWLLAALATSMYAMLALKVGLALAGREIFPTAIQYVLDVQLFHLFFFYSAAAIGRRLANRDPTKPRITVLFLLTYTATAAGLCACASLFSGVDRASFFALNHAVPNSILAWTSYWAATARRRKSLAVGCLALAFASLNLYCGWADAWEFKSCLQAALQFTVAAALYSILFRCKAFQSAATYDVKHVGAVAVAERNSAGTFAT